MLPGLVIRHCEAEKTIFKLAKRAYLCISEGTKVKQKTLCYLVHVVIFLEAHQGHCRKCKDHGLRLIPARIELHFGTYPNQVTLQMQKLCMKFCLHNYMVFR